MILKSKRREEKVICTFGGECIAHFSVSVFQLMKCYRIFQCEPHSWFFFKTSFNILFLKHTVYKRSVSSSWLHPLALGSPQSCSLKSKLFGQDNVELIS